MSVYLFQLRYENTISIFNVCGKIYSYNNVTEYIVLIVDYTHSDCTVYTHYSVTTTTVLQLPV